MIDSIVALILNSLYSDMEDNGLNAVLVVLDLFIRASSPGLAVKVPAATAASPSVLARVGLTAEILNASRRRRVFANFIHLVTSPLYIRSAVPKGLLAVF